MVQPHRSGVDHGRVGDRLVHEPSSRCSTGFLSFAVAINEASEWILGPALRTGGYPRPADRSSGSGAGTTVELPFDPRLTAASLLLCCRHRRVLLCEFGERFAYCVRGDVV